jgi:DNA-binding transcriptional ArsR family regulator
MVAKLRDVPAEWSDPGVTPPPPPAAERLLADLPTYLDWLKVVWPDHSPDPDLNPEAHALLNDPPALQELMISHLRMMWHGVLEAEWKRNLPMLQESVAAFQQMDYSGLTVYEAIRAVTGRDIRGHWQRKLQLAERLFFIPSAHAGPYLTKFAEDTTLRVVFGARLPKGYQYGSSALSRSELLVRLNALVDDTRLRILELLAQEDELCAQDIITRLGVSQSSVSRHLSQLSATGYISERRRDVAKCYSLNPDRVEETLKAVARFLKKKVSTPTP